MPYIYYDYHPKHGRFGNMLIRYFVCKILQLHYGHELATNDVTKFKEPVRLTDQLWMEWFKSDSATRLERFDWRTKDIVLEGFFQFDAPLNAHRSFLKSIVRADNDEPVNQEVRVCDIAKAVPTCPLAGPTDIVMHVRLDDFIHEGYNSEIAHYQHYLDVLDDHSCLGANVFIVVDALRNDYEKKYMAMFEKYKPIYVQQNMLEDFRYLMEANRIICSNSTFAWLAAFLGNAESIWILNNNFHGANQCLRRIGDASTYIEISNLDIRTGKVYRR